MMKGVQGFRASCAVLPLDGLSNESHNSSKRKELGCWLCSFLNQSINGTIWRPRLASLLSHHNIGQCSTAVARSITLSNLFRKSMSDKLANVSSFSKAPSQTLPRQPKPPSVRPLSISVHHTPVIQIHHRLNSTLRSAPSEPLRRLRSRSHRPIRSRVAQGRRCVLSIRRRRRLERARRARWLRVGDLHVICGFARLLISTLCQLW